MIDWLIPPLLPEGHPSGRPRRRPSSGMTWLYVFMVSEICECPRISMTTRGATPSARSNEAHACRRSWNRCARKAGCLEHAVEPPRGGSVERSPDRGGEYEAVLVHRVPAHIRSSSWRVRCARSDARRNAGRATVRLERSVWAPRAPTLIRGAGGRSGRSASPRRGRRRPIEGQELRLGGGRPPMRPCRAPPGGHHGPRRGTRVPGRATRGRISDRRTRGGSTRVATFR